MMTAGVAVTRTYPVAFRRAGFWAALALLVLNDHFLKGAGVLPPVLTGKLSDFAGLLVLPAVLTAALGGGRGARWLGCLVAGVGFTLVNLVPAVASGVAEVLGAAGVPSRSWSDPTDLVALPTLLPAWHLTAPYTADAPRGVSWWDRLALALGAVACVATSYAPPRSAGDVQAAGDGRLVMRMAYRGPLHVVEAESGNLLGSVDGDSSSERTAWLVRDHKLYSFDGAAGVRAFRLPGGEPLFDTLIDCRGCGVRLLSCGKMLVAAAVHPGRAGQAAGGWVFGLRAETGVLVWKQPFEPAGDFGQGEFDSPACAEDSVVLVTPTRLGVLSLRDGRQWRTVSAEAPGWPTVRDRVLYFEGGDGVVVGVQLDRGKETFRHRFRSTEVRSGRRDYAPFTVIGGMWLGASSSHVVAVDLATRRELWRRPSTGTVFGSDVVVTDVFTEHARVVDSATGQLLWQLPSGYVDPFPVERVVVVRSHPETQRVFDARTGQLLWSEEH